MSLAISIKVLISKFANLAQVLTAKRNDLQHSWLWAKPPNNWSVLIGFLIEYFNMKRGEGKKSHLCLVRTKRQKDRETISGRFYWCPTWSSAASISAKEKHELPLPCHQGSGKNCSITSTFPAEGGHVHFSPTLTQPHWRVAGLLVCPNSSVWIQKENKRKEMRKFILI